MNKDILMALEEERIQLLEFIFQMEKENSLLTTFQMILILI